MNPNETELTRIRYVRITNNLPFAFTDRHDGVPIIIAPGKSENLPLDMAAHFFGGNYDDPNAMLRHVARRQGWNTPEYVKVDPETGKNKAQTYFDLLTIAPVAYKLVPADDPDPRKPIPAAQEVRDEESPQERRKPGRPSRLESTTN